MINCTYLEVNAQNDKALKWIRYIPYVAYIYLLFKLNCRYISWEGKASLAFQSNLFPKDLFLSQAGPLIVGNCRELAKRGDEVCALICLKEVASGCFKKREN